MNNLEKIIIDETTLHEQFAQNLSDHTTKHRIAVVACIVLMLVISFFCLFFGHYGIGIDDVLGIIAHGTVGFIAQMSQQLNLWIPVIPAFENPLVNNWDPVAYSIVWDTRVPEVFGALLVGGGLAISGACYQGVFRNPLVSEGILGVSAGASLGACIGILLQTNSFLVSALAFIGGTAAVSITYFTSRVFNGNPTLLLVLSGTVVSSLFSSGVSIAKYLAPQDTALPEITFWLMGSFGRIGRENLLMLFIVVVVGFIVIQGMTWKLNLLALGDDDARALGVNVERSRLIVIGVSTFITAIAVCLCGMIGWVGVVVPQIVRMGFGPNFKNLIPYAFLFGATFMMIVDLICRSLLTMVIPVGIVTSLVGAPFYLAILKRQKEGWL